MMAMHAIVRATGQPTAPSCSHLHKTCQHVNRDSDKHQRGGNEPFRGQKRYDGPNLKVAILVCLKERERRRISQQKKECGGGKARTQSSSLHSVQDQDFGTLPPQAHATQPHDDAGWKL